MTVLPTFFDTNSLYQGPYAARIQAFTEAGRSATYPPAAQDRERIALILVDYQHDFVDPTGTLYVPGAREDVARLLHWFYTNAHKITTVYASLDTHIPYQIFYSSWWVKPGSNEHPQPYTVITVEDVEKHVWIPVTEPDWSVEYVRQLQQRAKKDLMIWPHHTMEGTLGHMLVAPLSEALAWYSAARSSLPVYIEKGLTTRTEFYGIFGAEVPDPQSSDSSLNIALIDEVMQHDRVYIAGEAKSHCVLETERQIVEYLKEKGQTQLLQKLYLLKDCTSSVQHPTIDFEAMAESALANMQQLGMHLVTSEEGIE
jgi:nicotinamidase/pyrazinamidase